MKKLYSIYSDGNYFPRAKKSGFGGYIESPNGEVLVEYTEQIKQSHYIYNFELLGIIRGLQLALSMGLKNIISYCDDKTTMLRLEEIVMNGGSVEHLPKNSKPELFAEIITLSKQFSSSTFQYIPRTQNKHSDSLSRRYSALMERNFVRQYNDDLIFSENTLQVGEKPTKRIFFSHPLLVKVQEKNNPFLVAPTRNRKTRKVSKVEQQNTYQFLFIETIKNNENKDSLHAFHYLDKDNKTLLSSQEYLNKSLTIEEYCHFLTSNIEKISHLNNGLPLWIYSNSSSMNKFFEQKDKLPKEAFFAFHNVFNTLNDFPRIMFHTLPFTHEYTPEISFQEEKKKNLNENIETIDSLMLQLEGGILGREQHKCFGKLIRYQLRNYRTLLSRELNEVEKREIITQTTSDLEKKGLIGLPNMSNRTFTK